MKTDHRDPNDLRLHPLRKTVLLWSKDDPRLDHLSDAIAEGFDPAKPIVVIEPNLVIEGVGRWLAAKRQQLRSVPVVVTTEPPTLVLLRDWQRRHFSKGALAYLVAPMFEEAVRDGIKFRSQNLRKGQCSPETVSDTVSGNLDAGGILERLGIGFNTLEKARQVHKLFLDPKPYPFPTPEGDVEMTLKAWFEPKIMAQHEGDEHEGRRPLGLGALLKAIGSIKVTKGAARLVDPQLELFTGGLGAVSKRFVYWTQFSDDEKRAAEPALEQFLDAMPEDLLERLEAKIKARRRRAVPQT
jgi:hypothetical protein